MACERILKANGTKRAQRVVAQRADGVDGGADESVAQVVDAAASEVFHRLVLNVVEPEQATLRMQLTKERRCEIDWIQMPDVVLEDHAGRTLH